LAWLGLAWLGLAWLGLAWLGLAWLGLAWLGLAWLGLAWLSVMMRTLSEVISGLPDFAEVQKDFTRILGVTSNGANWAAYCALYPQKVPGSFFTKG